MVQYATALSLLALLVTSVLAAGPAEVRHMTVTREEDRGGPRTAEWVMAQGYASVQGQEMLRAVAGRVYRSPDHGQSWTEAEVIPGNESLGQGLYRSTSIACFYLDPDNGLLVRFLDEVLAKSGEFAYGDATGYGPHTMRIFYQISRDGGHSWEPRQQLVENGRRYNERHWGRDVWYKRSSLCVEGQTPHKLKDGTMVLPAYLWPTHEYMDERFEKQHWPAELRKDAPYFIESRCLLLRWKSDLSGLEFASGGPVIAPGGYTFAGTCGSDEPAIAYLDDHRWLAVVRTGTGHVDDFRQRSIPMLRACALTEDGGLTWKLGEPLRFDDGGTVYSPCAWSQFIRSSKTGKWYWIGNILGEPTYGNCDPRYPLQIVELNGKTLRLKRSTVTVIEDKAPEDDKWVRFSNFRTYEERGTGDLILLMTKSYCEFAPAGLPTPAYRYRIRMAE